MTKYNYLSGTVSRYLILPLVMLLVYTSAMAATFKASIPSSISVDFDGSHLSKDTIRNQLQGDYLKQVSTDVFNLKEGKIGEILSKFSGYSPDWNWTIKEGKLPENINATTSSANGVTTTTLNTGSLNKATRLSVARTIIHEMIHAYLTLYFRNESKSALLNYPGIMEAWKASKKPDLNEIQHDEIERSFIGEIAGALKEYDQATRITIDADNLYSDMSWGGLDFAGNNDLSDQDKVRIQQRLDAEQFSL